MSLPLRLLFNSVRKSRNVFTEVRQISVFPSLRLKQVNEVRNGNEIIVSADIIPSPREPHVVKNENPSKCPLCSSGLQLKHTDVLILSQFLRSDGCILPRRVTGLCKRQQKLVSNLIIMAQKAGLMPNINPSNSKNDPKKRYGWKKHNKYFDETTIKIR